MKVIPNCISFIRIIFSLFLLFIKPLSAAFYIIYIICGFTDIIDGYIARKTETASVFGGKLDSAADMVMAGVLLTVLYSVINPPVEILIWVVAIAGIRLASMGIAMKKYRTFASIHTYGNKITGMALFIFPFFILYFNTTILMYLICAAASISAVEELLIQLTSSCLQINKQSIFIK